MLVNFLNKMCSYDAKLSHTSYLILIGNGTVILFTFLLLDVIHVKFVPIYVMYAVYTVVL